MEKAKLKEAVKEKYGSIAKENSSCCAPSASCCGSEASTTEISRQIGYSQAELQAVPEGANLGLGCGNPLAFAGLKAGDTVLDLGSGAGFDSFLAARQVGPQGKVIGIDMTAEMVAKAQVNAQKGNYTNVEFKLAEIEGLPLAKNSVDVILSNCVINLSTEKLKVFSEALRVLKPGGRLMVSDIVLLAELPKPIKDSIEAYVGCVAGASLKDDYLKTIERAGFQDIEIQEETSFPVAGITQDPMVRQFIEGFNVSEDETSDIISSVVSIKVSATKPGTRT